MEFTYICRKRAQASTYTNKTAMSRYQDVEATFNVQRSTTGGDKANGGTSRTDERGNMPPAYVEVSPEERRLNMSTFTAPNDYARLIRDSMVRYGHN